MAWPSTTRRARHTCGPPDPDHFLDRARPIPADTAQTIVSRRFSRSTDRTGEGIGTRPARSCVVQMSGRARGRIYGPEPELAWPSVPGWRPFHPTRRAVRGARGQCNATRCSFETDRAVLQKPCCRGSARDDSGRAGPCTRRAGVGEEHRRDGCEEYRQATAGSKSAGAEASVRPAASANGRRLRISSAKAWGSSDWSPSDSAWAGHGMHLDDQPVGAGGDGRDGEGRDELGAGRPRGSGRRSPAGASHA